MPSAERRPIEIDPNIEDLPVELAPSGRKTSLIYGSVEMLEAQSRLAMNRLAALGSVANHFTLELYPVEKPAEA